MLMVNCGHREWAGWKLTPTSRLTSAKSRMGPRVVTRPRYPGGGLHVGHLALRGPQHHHSQSRRRDLPGRRSKNRCSTACGRAAIDPALWLQIRRMHFLRGQTDRRASGPVPRRLRSTTANSAKATSSCVSQDRSPTARLKLASKSHDRLYRNPFADPLAPHELKPDIATPRES